MKNKLTRLVCALVAVMCIPALSYATVATLDPINNPADCDKFNQSNTVIAVYKEGGDFGTVLDAVANNSKYNALSFYQIILDGTTHDVICGRSWAYEPTVFINNQGQEMSSDTSAADFNDWFNQSLDTMVASSSSDATATAIESIGTW